MDCAQFSDQIEIKTGYVPAITGRVVELLISHMNVHFGFAASFETRVAGDLAEFVSRLDSTRNQIWRAENRGRIVGSISIDGGDLQQGVAHLRWFIVSEGLRCAGVGRALLSQALNFCDGHGFGETHLWTVKGLDAARRLYEKHGFELAEEYCGDQWGTHVLEQKFVRYRRMIT